MSDTFRFVPPPRTDVKLPRMERRGTFEKTTGSEKTYQLGKARDAWRETMLDVRLDGEAFALPYAHLSLIKCEEERSLSLTSARTS